MIHTQENQIQTLTRQITNLTLGEGLAVIVKQFPGQVTFSTSFSIEDQVITHEIISHQLDSKLFTLDTGRLFAETYSVWNQTHEKYGATITAYYPEHTAIEKFVSEKGPNSFYESVENRKACCYIRKVEPLKRALAGNKVWITGLRAEHSPSRQDMQVVEWDESNRIIKYNPLLHWETKAIVAYIREHQVPYNSLHDKGFVSIGCAPCTRAVRAGEDFRAGRWWWEDNSKKECGLHVHQ
jgi:phosphoadenosine phosphosulfate reductase